MKTVALCCVSVLSACAPRFGDEPWRVTEPRVLAVKSEPAEIEPGGSVELTAFVATAPDLDEPATLSWSFCTAPKPVAENNVVASACLGESASLAIGRGVSVGAQVPFNGCALFGPDTPPGGFRPRDPDVTGGYYQPVRVESSHAAVVFHLERIRCNLGQASFDVAAQFSRSYVPNQNPRLLPIEARVNGSAVALDRIPSGSDVELEVGWLAEDAETYADFELATQSVITKREGMRVAWFASAGRLDVESTGRAGDDSVTTTTNRWQAPGEASMSKLWVVLRDSRGGVDFATYELSVAR
jgi:hypothetical protein